MMKFKRIGVLTSGGDAPGMNDAVRAVVRSAIANGVEVMGIYRGYSGLIDGDIHQLDVHSVCNVINRGGTILYSDRCPAFMTEEGRLEAVETCRRFGIDGIIAIGGDGTFRGATALTALGIPCIGLPGTIDNDITSTDSTIGYDTAMNTVVELVDKLRDTCESHARCNVVEVMGRDACDIALNTGIATGATAIVISEIPFSEEELFEKMKRSRKLGKRNFIIIVSEAMGKEYGPALTKRIEAATGIETRFARLAHIVRGGNPTLADRVMATEMGVFAVDELLRGNSNLVICSRRGKVVATEIRYALALDDLYKGFKTREDLQAEFSEWEIERMEIEVEARHIYVKNLYNIAETVNI